MKNDDDKNQRSTGVVESYEERRSRKDRENLEFVAQRGAKEAHANWAKEHNVCPVCLSYFDSKGTHSDAPCPTVKKADPLEQRVTLLDKRVTTIEAAASTKKWTDIYDGAEQRNPLQAKYDDLKRECNELKSNNAVLRTNLHESMDNCSQLSEQRDVIEEERDELKDAHRIQTSELAVEKDKCNALAIQVDKLTHESNYFQNRTAILRADREEWKNKFEEVTRERDGLRLLVSLYTGVSWK